MQSAYEVLSDPQERAWYDTHRESILRGGNGNGEHYEHNIRITTAEDILQMFSKFNRRIDFSDSPTGFYGALRELFDKLAREENDACEWNDLEPVEYPSFGHKDDDFDDVVRAFYSIWNGFATKKAFSWKDVYNYAEAPDRQIRRMMEKENKRLRDEGAREFNDAVRSLVAFVRKRDPRYKPNKQSEKERQQILKDAAVAQAARSRAANQAKFNLDTIPEWMRTSATNADDLADDEWAETSPVKENVECVVCSKTFKSEKQYETHEKSKKHIKAVEQIRRQMRREDFDISLDLQEKAFDSPEVLTRDVEGLQEEGASEHPNDNAECPPSLERSEGLAIDTDKDAYEAQDNNIVPDGPDRSSVSDEDCAHREKVEQRLLSQDDNSKQSSVLQGVLDDNETIKKPKLGKAKEKRAKKAAQQSSMSILLGNGFKCAACSEGFPSRTQLFRHLKEFGHDRPMAGATNGGKEKGL